MLALKVLKQHFDEQDLFVYKLMCLGGWLTGQIRGKQYGSKMQLHSATWKNH